MCSMKTLFSPSTRVPQKGRRTAGSIAALALLGAAAACNPSAPPSTPSSDAAAHGDHQPSAKPPRTTLLGNLGAHHRAITTSVTEAQRFFDEGLTLLYGFNHEEAYRSFQRAAALDPNAPMPHWGMSLALGTNYNDTATPDRLGQAYRHVRDAMARVANGSEVERGLVEALARRYVETPDDGQQPAREEAYSIAMGELSARFPDDLDAATLYAESLMNLRPWKLYNADGTPAPGTDTIVKTLESVLARNPMHPGANHYYIHAVEASSAPERALDSAKRLETLVPGAGHLVHMPAHIYIRTGDYLASAKSNADAARADEQYIEATGATGFYPLMYYAHNLQFESAALMFAGHYEGARAAAQKTVQLVAPLAGEMVMAQPFALQDGLVYVRFEKWDQALAVPAPPAGRPVQAAYYHYVRGAALAGKGDESGARKEAAALAAAAAQIPPDAAASTANSANAMVEVAKRDLDARIADLGDPSAAVEAWRAAVAAEEKLGYSEPPDWLLPTREGLGNALLRSGRAAEAEQVFRADLAVFKDNPRSLFGLVHSLVRQNKPLEAAVARARFEKAWRGADTTLDDRRIAAR